MLKEEFPKVRHPWYSDDTGAAGVGFTEISRHSLRGLSRATLYGYYPEASKNILVVGQHNLEAANKLFASQQFQVSTGYLGGYIGAQRIKTTPQLRGK
jgi:hypothetical protein